MRLRHRALQEVSHAAPKCPSLDHISNRKPPASMFSQKQYSSEALRPWFGSTRTRSGSYCYGYAKKGKKPLGTWSYLGYMNYYTKSGLNITSFENFFSVGNRLSSSAGVEAENTPFASIVHSLMADPHVSAFYFHISESGEIGVHVLRDNSHDNHREHNNAHHSNQSDHFASGHYPYLHSEHQGRGTHNSEHSAEHLELNSHLSAMLAGRGHNPFADLMHTNGDHTAHIAAEEAKAIQHAIHEALAAGHNHSESLHFVAGMHHFHSEIEVYHWYHHEHSGHSGSHHGSHYNSNHEQAEDHDDEGHGPQHPHHSSHDPSVHAGHSFESWLAWWHHGNDSHHESHRAHEGNHEHHSHHGHHESHGGTHEIGNHGSGDKSNYGFLGHGWNSQAHPFWEYAFHHHSNEPLVSHAQYTSPHSVMTEHIQHSHRSEAPHSYHSSHISSHGSTIEDHVIAQNLAHSAYDKKSTVQLVTTGASSDSDRSN